MRPRRVLITGASRYLGGRLARALAQNPQIETVIGVDTMPPPAELAGVEFVRADIRNPLIGRVIAGARVDTVVHLNVLATPAGTGGRMAMKEINVIGTMQLLAACQKADTVAKFVLKSTTAVYGSSPRAPALYTEEMEPRALPRAGYAKDAAEVEGYVRGFGRRRPDVALTLLRFANFIGSRIDTPLTRFFSLPVVPTVLGFDPRIQFCHEDDALEVLRLATLEDRACTVNVAGDGVLLLSQAIRRAGRPAWPVPPPAVNLVGRALRRLGVADFSPEHVRFLRHGRACDTTRLHTAFGYAPRYTTAAAFEEFAAARPGPLRSAAPVLAAEQRLLDVLEHRGLARA